VLGVDEVFADPQVRHLELVADVPHPTGDGDVRVLRHPVTMSGTPVTAPGGPPRAGADTRTVLAELGYEPGEVDALLASGAAAEARQPGATFL
jgi:crotonobetainyl-CoA:carnitine CoA-transferase CaiB-like acyl-CoA transferase